MEYLSLRIGNKYCRGLYFDRRVFVDTNCNKRGQTSRPVATDQVQTCSNFKEGVYCCNLNLGCAYCWRNDVLFNRVVTLWYGNINIFICLLTTIFCYTKIFITLRHNQIQVQEHVSTQRQPRQATPLNMARYRKAVSSALWLQLTLVVCYLPYGVAVASTPHGVVPLSFLLARHYSGTLVYLNSSLNPLLYCWKIREIRQAVKETLRQLGCLPG